DAGDDGHKQRRVEAVQQRLWRAVRAGVGADYGGGGGEEQGAADLERRVDEAARKALLLRRDAVGRSYVQGAVRQGKGEADQEPKRHMAPMLARSSDPERRIPRRTSGEDERCSIVAKAPSRATTPTSEQTVRNDVQPSSGAWTMVKTSSSIAPVRLIAPP